MADKKTVCGIIMPISTSDEVHTERHWQRVKAILSKAIENAGCCPQPVWEKGEYDIIQARILRNIFENEIVVCDISTRNPNVMLEWGMRLTTKKPTLVVAEVGTVLPFDTGVIHTEFYDPSLEWSSAQTFIERLSEVIRSTLGAHASGEYHPYLETFKFETVEPATVTVPADQRLEARFDHMERQLTVIFDYMRERDVPDDWSLGQDAMAEAFGEPGKLSILPEVKGSPRGPYAPAQVVRGDKVHHKKFGVGEVVLVDGSKITANFGRHGQRKVLDTFLQKLPF